MANRITSYLHDEDDEDAIKDFLSKHDVPSGDVRTRMG